MTTNLKFIGLSPGVQNTHKMANPATDALWLNSFAPTGGAAGPLVIGPVSAVTGTNLIFVVKDEDGGNTRFSITGAGSAAISSSQATTSGSALTITQNGVSANIFVGSAAPTSGVAAAEGSIYLQDAGATGSLWVKTGSLSTDWTVAGTAPAGATSVFTGPISASQVGTSELHIGSVYMESGNTIVYASTRAMVGATSGAETAILNIRRFTGGTLLASFTRAASLGNQLLDGGVDINVVASDWYDLYLVAGGATETAYIKGLHIITTPT